MIYLSFVFALASAGALLFAFSAKRDAKRVATWASLGSFLIAAVLFLFSCVAAVESGHVGVPVLFGSVMNQTVPSGLHVVNPFVSVRQMSIRTENYWLSHQAHEGGKPHDDSVSVRSSNGLQMPVDVSVPYRLLPEAAPWVFQNLGPDYADKLIRVSLSTATRPAASQYTAEQLYSNKRDEFAARIMELFDGELNSLLKENYKGESPPEQVVAVSQVLVGHVGIPETVRNAIENKLRSDQEQQAMDFQILKEEKEAKRKKVEAQGIKQFQDIVTTGISDRLLRWKAIDATLHLASSKNAKIIVIGSGKDGLPVLLGSDASEDRKK